MQNAVRGRRELFLSQLDDGIRYMFVRDIVIPTLHAEAVGCAENIGDGAALGRDEFKTSHFEKLAVGVAEVDGVHETAVDWAGVLNPESFQALRDLGVGSARDVEGNVVQVADILRVGGRVVGARRPHKEGDQTPVARIEIQVVLFRDIQVGLLEDERHAQHPLVEIDDGLAVRTNKGKVVDPLGLNSGHRLFSVIS